MLSRSALWAIDGMGNASDRANLHVSSNSSQYDIHIPRLLIRTGNAADIGIHIS
jgi:hypothetical protein